MKLEFQALDEQRPVSRTSLFVSPLLEALRAGRARIARGWCQGKYRNNLGDAVAWCARGAVYDDELAVMALWKILKDYSTLPQYGVARYNDNPYTTQADILSLYDRAIAAEERSPLCFDYDWK